MNFKKIGVLILVFLLVLVNIRAFQLTSTEDSVSLCPRNTQLFIDLVKNDGQQEQLVDVKVAGSSAAWATSIPTGFVLAPGEERAVYTYLTPMSNTFPANYDLDVKVNTADSSKIAHHTINVKDCHALTTSADLVKETCSGEKVTYEINVNNLGEFQEIYNLNVEGNIKDKVSLSENNIKLNPDETKKIIVYVESPKESGDYEFEVVTKSQTGAVSYTKFRLVVNSCYDYSISADKDFLDFCDQSKQIVTLTLTNNGKLANQYGLSVDGPLWASLENTKVTLNPKESRKINLILTPDYSVSGNFEIKIKTLPDKGDTKAETVIKTKINDCNSVFVNVMGAKDEICNLITAKYDVVVKNNGKVAHTFIVNLDAPKWVSLDESKSFNLAPEAEKKLKLVVSPGFDVESTDYKIKLKVVAADEPGINYEDSISIKTVSKKDCYKVDVKPQKDSVEVKYDGSATVPISIINLGMSKATYELSLSDTATAFTQLNPSVIDVDYGGSEVVYAYIAPNAEIKSGDYNAVVSAKLRGSDILGSGSFSVKVSDSLIVVQEQSLWTKIKNYVGGILYKTQVEKNKTDANETKVVINETKSNVKTENKPVETKTNQTPIKITANVISEDVILEKTFEGSVSIGESINLTVSNLMYNLIFEKIRGDSVVLSMDSSPNYMYLKEGQWKLIDINDDDVLDIKITLNNLEVGKATIKVEKYIISKQEGSKSSIVNKIKSVFSSIVNKIKSISFMSTISKYKIIIVLTVVVLLILIIVWKTKFHKKLFSFFEEEEPKENQDQPRLV